MTTTTKLAAASLIFAAMNSWTAIAHAEHFSGACASELNQVESSINSAVFLGNRATSNRSNLQSKLDAAAAKIQLLKYDDAVDKLLDISDTATLLANATKPKLQDATSINNAVGDAITCVGALN